LGLQLHLKPKRTIRVIAWMNEENGSRGSKQYAKDHASEFANHFAVNETDGGADHPIGLNLKAKPEIKKIFEPVAKVLQEIGAGTLNLSEHIGADIEPMEKAGVPAWTKLFRANCRKMPRSLPSPPTPWRMPSNRCRDESGNPACRVIPSVSRGIPLRIVTLARSLFKCG